MTARGAEAIENAAVAAGAKACWRGMPVIMVVLCGATGSDMIATVNYHSSGSL